MDYFGPVTRFSNRTNDVMVLIMRNVHGHVEYRKVIPAGGHVDLWYRKGINRIGAKVTFLVQPESRSGVPGKAIFPFTVFELAKIDVCYKLGNGLGVDEYEDGAFIDFDFMKSNMFRRIGLVRKLPGVFAAFAPTAPLVVEIDVPSVATQGSAPILQSPEIEVTVI